MSDETTDFRPKSLKVQEVEHRLGAPLPVLLDRYYTQQRMSQAQVARVMRVSRTTVIDWMAEHGIPTRDRRALAAEAATA